MQNRTNSKKGGRKAARAFVAVYANAWPKWAAVFPHRTEFHEYSAQAVAAVDHFNRSLAAWPQGVR